MHRHVSFVHVICESGSRGMQRSLEANFSSIAPNTEVEFAKTEFFHFLRLVSMFVQMYNGIQTKKQIEKRGERQGES
jgi:hypothetical protein